MELSYNLLKLKRSKSSISSVLVKELNNHLILVFQLVLSVLTAFAFGYFTPYLVYGVVAIDTRLITGILFAFVVGIADLYFVIRYFLRLDGVFPFDEDSAKKSL